MPSSSTEICNRAIMLCGVGEEIASLDERSPEALACNSVYEKTVREMQREFDWNFNRKIQTLSLVEEDPNDGIEYDYSYGLPSDCVAPRNIVSGAKPETPQSRIPYEIGSDGTQTLLYTDQEDAVLRYSASITDEALFPDDFCEALSHRIAYKIAPRLIEDPSKMADKIDALLAKSVSLAKAACRSERKLVVQDDSEFTRGR